MDPSLAPYISVALILLLMAVGVPVFAALAIAGGTGIIMVENFGFLLNRLKSMPYSTTAAYTLIIIPLFILMGSFAHHAEVGKKLFSVASKWVGHLPGGLAMSAILTSAGFAATSGSSVATAATVGSVALPEMRKAGYEPSLSAGTVAAGGVLGVGQGHRAGGVAAQGDDLERDRARVVADEVAAGGRERDDGRAFVGSRAGLLGHEPLAEEVIYAFEPRGLRSRGGRGGRRRIRRGRGGFRRRSFATDEAEQGGRGQDEHEAAHHGRAGWRKRGGQGTDGGSPCDCAGGSSSRGASGGGE